MKKVAIVCRAPSSEMMAPFDDDSYDIWCLAWCIDRYPRVDLAFEIHESLGHQPDGYVNDISSRSIPLIVGSKFPAKADHISVFPFEDAEQAIGGTYLTSSAAYMIALAVLRGYDRIELYGVDMSVDSNEYFRQRPCMEKWIGYAKGVGIEVFIPDVSPLCKSSYVYGAESAPDAGVFSQSSFSEMADMHRARIEAIRSKVADLEREIIAHNGAAQAYDKMAETARAYESGDVVLSLKQGVMLK